MNPAKNSELTVQTLLALRKENDAVRLITERLRVKEMGPADHIRTKHEARKFVETGGAHEAEALIRAAHERREWNLVTSQSISQNQSLTARETPLL